MDWGAIAIVAVKAFGVWLGATFIGVLAARKIAKFLRMAFKSQLVIATMAFGLSLMLAGFFEFMGLAMIIGAYVMGLALSRTDLLLDGIVILAFGIIHHIKVNGSSLALFLGHDAVFLFRFQLDPHHMLRHAFQHIMALPDVNEFIPDADAVYPSMLILLAKAALAFQIVIHVLLIRHGSPP